MYAYASEKHWHHFSYIQLILLFWFIGCHGENWDIEPLFQNLTIKLKISVSTNLTIKLKNTVSDVVGATDKMCSDGGISLIRGMGAGELALEWWIRHGWEEEGKQMERRKQANVAHLFFSNCILTLFLSRRVHSSMYSACPQLTEAEMET